MALTRLTLADEPNVVGPHAVNAPHTMQVLAQRANGRGLAKLTVQDARSLHARGLHWPEPGYGAQRTAVQFVADTVREAKPRPLLLAVEHEAEQHLNVKSLHRELADLGIDIAVFGTEVPPNDFPKRWGILNADGSVT